MEILPNLLTMDSDRARDLEFGNELITTESVTGSLISMGGCCGAENSADGRFKWYL